MMRSLISACRSNVLFKRYVKDSKGVAAIEFAFIAPILILLFIGTLEISYAVAVDRKISRVSSTIADLITQDTQFTVAELNDLMDVSSRIMKPYNEPASNIKISIVSVRIEDGEAKVDWSHNYNGGDKPAPGSTYTIPTNIKINDTSLLTAKVTLDHKPAFSFIGYKNGGLIFDSSSISLSEQMYLRPRISSSSVECLDCT